MPPCAIHRLTESVPWCGLCNTTGRQPRLTDTFERGINDELEDQIDVTGHPPAAARRTDPVERWRHAAGATCRWSTCRQFQIALSAAVT